MTTPRTGATGGTVWDTARSTYNVMGNYLVPNLSDAEASINAIDILSNGFKPRKTGTGLNADGDTYIYLCFADQPFKFANAR